MDYLRLFVIIICGLFEIVCQIICRLFAGNFRQFSAYLFIICSSFEDCLLIICLFSDYLLFVNYLCEIISRLFVRLFADYLRLVVVGKYRLFRLFVVILIYLGY